MIIMRHNHGMDKGWHQLPHPILMGGGGGATSQNRYNALVGKKRPGSRELAQNTVRKIMHQGGAEPDASGCYSTEQICACLFGDLRAERLRKERELVRKYRIENETAEANLLDRAALMQGLAGIADAMVCRIMSSALDKHVVFQQGDCNFTSHVDRIHYADSKVYVSLTKEAILQAPEFHVPTLGATKPDTQNLAGQAKWKERIIRVAVHAVG